MNRIVNPVIIPAIVPTVFSAIVTLPVEVLGCQNRGLVAIRMALVGSLTRLGAVTIGAIRIAHDDPETRWWVVKASVLDLW